MPTIHAHHSFYENVEDMAKVAGCSSAELMAKYKQLSEEAHVGLLLKAPFVSHPLDAELKEVFTLACPTAATDGRAVFINPLYVFGDPRKPRVVGERVFIYAHEVWHCIQGDPKRYKHYVETGVGPNGKPFDAQLYQHCMDLVINADLVKHSIGTFNQSWAFDPGVTGEMSPDEVYNQRYREKPPERGGQGGGQGQPPEQQNPRAPEAPEAPQNQDSQQGQPQPQPRQQPGQQGTQGQPPTPSGTPPGPPPPATVAEAQPEPELPQPGQHLANDVLPGEPPADWQETIEFAYKLAKAMGKAPASFERAVEAGRASQISWREELALVVAGTIGHRGGSTWSRIDRRRLAFKSLVLMPGRQGFGAGTVACVFDTSGSISDEEIAHAKGELSAVVETCAPQEVIVMACDAAVHEVHRVSSLDEVERLGSKGYEITGGGGTSFIPPFEWLAEQGVTPDALIYVTDGYGRWPDPEMVKFPVVWAVTTDVDPPAGLGTVVRVKLNEM